MHGVSDGDRVSRDYVISDNDDIESGKDVRGTDLAEEYNDRLKKMHPGALINEEKRREKFVRIGRRQQFVRIGKKSEMASGIVATEAKQGDTAIPYETEHARIDRKIHLVLSGKKHDPLDVDQPKTAEKYNNRMKKIHPGALIDEEKRHRHHFVRIGRKSEAANEIAAAGAKQGDSRPTIPDEREYARVDRNVVLSGKNSFDIDEPKTADEYNDRLKKIHPGALIGEEKRREKFVRIGRRHQFVRIGKKSEMANETAAAGAEQGGNTKGTEHAGVDKRVVGLLGGKDTINIDQLKTADEYNDRLKKIHPGALIDEEKRRRHHFVRIGKKSEAASADAAAETKRRDGAIPDETEHARVNRKVHFVRIGRKPVYFDRSAKTYPPNDNNNAEYIDVTEPRKGFARRGGERMKFVRIGRYSGATKPGSQDTVQEEELDRLV